MAKKTEEPIQVHKTEHGYTQYEYEPDTEAQKAAKQKEHDEWCESRTAYNIPHEYMAFNYNGHDMSKPVSYEISEEHFAVWHFAIEQIKQHPDRKAWDTFMSVHQAYQKHIASGVVADADFDPTRLEVVYK